MRLLVFGQGSFPAFGDARESRRKAGWYGFDEQTYADSSCERAVMNPKPEDSGGSAWGAVTAGAGPAAGLALAAVMVKSVIVVEDDRGLRETTATPAAGCSSAAQSPAPAVARLPPPASR